MALYKRQQFLLPEQSGSNLGKKTLVLDLDETLVHSGFDKAKETTFSIQVLLEYFQFIKVPTSQSKITVNIIVRPEAQRFLYEMKNYFEIVIFTASLREYADKVIDQLDPRNECISYRLFREHCTQYHGTLIKDLKKLGRNLKNIIIIDVISRFQIVLQNSADCFILQKENGYLISSFFNDMEDDELLYLIPFLKELSELEDVRNVEWWKQRFDELALESLESKKIQNNTILVEEEEFNESDKQLITVPISLPNQSMPPYTQPSKGKPSSTQMISSAKEMMNEDFVKKVMLKGKSLANYELPSLKTIDTSKSENYVAMRFKKNRQQLKLKVSQTRFAVDASNFMSPLTKRLYYDQKNEVILIN